jgi:hypothetical protein
MPLKTTILNTNWWTWKKAATIIGSLGVLATLVVEGHTAIEVTEPFQVANHKFVDDELSKMAAKIGVEYRIQYQGLIQRFDSLTLANLQTHRDALRTSITQLLTQKIQLEQLLATATGQQGALIVQINGIADDIDTNKNMLKNVLCQIEKATVSPNLLCG